MTDLRLKKLENKNEISKLETELISIKHKYNTNLIAISEVDIETIKNNYDCGVIDIKEASIQRANVYTNLAKELYPYLEVSNYN